MAGVLTDVREDGVAVVTLDAPETRNALSLDMNAALIAAFDELEASEDVGAVVVTGAPPAFSAGGNLDDLLDATHDDHLHEIYAGFLRVAGSPLPTVAAVNGPAVGAGMNFVLACDLVVAGSSARFDCRFLQIAIHPGGGHTWRLRRLTDRQTVMAMVVFGEVVSAARAVEVGLAWKTVDDADLLDEATAIAARAAAHPRELVRRTKETIDDMDAVTTSLVAVEREIGPQRWSMQQPEFRERVSELKARISKKA